MAQGIPSLERPVVATAPLIMAYAESLFLFMASIGQFEPIG